MKRVAKDHKHWLFKGSLAAGERAANLMTSIVTALRNNLDVHAYTVYDFTETRERAGPEKFLADFEGYL